MTRLKAPLWLFAAGASFLGYFCLLVYCEIRRPDFPGVVPEFIDGRLIVSDVVDDSAGAQAGLQPGDHIVASGGRPLRSQVDWMLVRVNVVEGRPIVLQVDRGGNLMEATVAVELGQWSHWTTADGMVLLTVRSAQLATLILAVFVAFRRPDDAVVRLGAWLLASLAVFSVNLPYGIAAVVRELPTVFQLALAFAAFSSLGVAALFSAFFARFLHPVRRVGRVWILASIPMVLVLAWHARVAFEMVFRADAARTLPNRSAAIIAISLAYIVAGFAVIVTGYRKLEDATERRRVRVVVTGAAVGCTAGSIVVMRYWLGGGDLANSLFGSPVTVMGALLFLAFPVSFAFAILRHRLFDISVIIRQGIRYALARRLLLSLVPALTVLLVVDLLLHGDDPLLTTLRARGWTYVGLAGLATLAYAKRQPWLEELDRRFFRERYDAYQLLRQVASEVRAGGDLDQAVSRVLPAIVSALHPVFAVLLVRERGRPDFRPMGQSPPGFAAGGLAAEAKLTGLLRLLERPLDVSLFAPGTIMRQLPPNELRFLESSGIELLVPVAIDAQGAEALLALGAKRSEEPYSREDQDLLAAIAESLGRLLHGERPATPADAFEECPTCGACYDVGTAQCADDGDGLTTTPMARTLAGRYRLERRIGSGGMGTVYAAVDAELERRVAVKLIREDLLVSAAAASRFTREARIAAGFTHPNVVTVHDFGTVGARAFLVMELIEGRTLRDELRLGASLEPSRVVEILRGVCRAVEAAHRQGLVHRDLKADNVFLVNGEPDEIVKVFDFGIAKALGASAAPDVETEIGVLVGTPRYMAPEQLRGEKPQSGWDVWALTVMAYEMLTGQHPFEDGHGWQNRAFKGDAASFGDALSQLPAACDEFFVNALAFDPSRRPGSARQLLSDFERAVHE